jgi:periplasmic divalent cation tolerance protein
MSLVTDTPAYRVKEMHPYDVPEFVVLPIVDGNDAYLRWVGESTRPE